MRYLVSFVDEWKAKGNQIADVCIIDAQDETTAITAARTVCRQTGNVKVLALPDRLSIENASLGRCLGREEAAAICDRLARQLINTRSRHG